MRICSLDTESTLLVIEVDDAQSAMGVVAYPDNTAIAHWTAVSWYLPVASMKCGCGIYNPGQHIRA